MPNTYVDNPTRGLSKLQRAILVRLGESYRHMENNGLTPWEDREASWAGHAWHTHAPFYGRARYREGRSQYYYGEAPAVSRALRRLEGRGLVVCHRSMGGYVETVELTQVGRQKAHDLMSTGCTDLYRDKGEEPNPWD